MDCPFCAIASKREKANIVWESDYVVAFMDRNPINPGHVLVVPRVHEPDFHRLSDRDYSELWQIVRVVADMIDNVFKPKKVGLIAVGFDVPHTHIHVVPMHDYHDITSKHLLEGKRPSPSFEELEEVAKKLRAAP